MVGYKNTMIKLENIFPNFSVPGRFWRKNLNVAVVIVQVRTVLGKYDTASNVLTVFR
jgi:hypothetical protein